MKLSFSVSAILVFTGVTSSFHAKPKVVSISSHTPRRVAYNFPPHHHLIDRVRKGSTPPDQLWRPASSVLHSSTVADAAPSSAVGESVTDGKNTDGNQVQGGPELGRFKAFITKIGMLTFIASMCVALPLSLLPPKILHRMRLISTMQRERISLRAGEFCSRWLMRLIPFAKVEIVNPTGEQVKEPTVWVCNHSSMLDVFFLLATAHALVNRPIKVVYWKQLEKNPVSRALFRACGFIPVQMADNGNGNDNEYDRASFKELLKSSKKAFEEGFDLGILPEGQLNPTPENGLLPVYPGAYTLSKMSKRPIRMMALYGTNRLWHPDASKGMNPTSRRVKVRLYPEPMMFESSDHFASTFEAVVGHFGANGFDLPEEELQRWLGATATTSKTA